MRPVRVGFTHPVLVADLLILAPLIETTQFFVIRIADARFRFIQLAHVLAPIVARIAPHDRLHRGVCFQVRGVDAHRLSLQQSAVLGGRQQEFEDHRVEFHRQPLSC